MERSDHHLGYYLLENEEVRPCTLEEWGKMMESDQRVIEKTEVGGFEVSTVFLGLEHGARDGKPLVFETMIFGIAEEYQERYTSLAEAKEGAPARSSPCNRGAIIR